MFTVGALHRICFWLHVSAASALLGFTLNATDDLTIYNFDVSTAFTAPSLWYYKCYSRDLEKYTDDSSCDDTDKHFSIVHPTTPIKNFKFNAFAAVIFFSYFSAFMHFIAMLCNSQRVGFWANATLAFPFTNDSFVNAKNVSYRTETVIRMIDYGCTASVMVALFSVLWGANNILGVFVSPIGLLIIIIVAFRATLKYVIPEEAASNLKQKGALQQFLLSCAPSTSSDTPNTKAAFGIFVLCIILYAALLGFGVIKSLAANSEKETDPWERRGVMPPGVTAASVFVLLTFSSFIIPYWGEISAFSHLADPDLNKDQVEAQRQKIVLTYSSAWSAMSLVSKIVLHITFGTTVVSQAQIFSSSDTEAPTHDMQISNRVIIGSLLVIGLGVTLFVLTRFWLLRSL